MKIELFVNDRYYPEDNEVLHTIRTNKSNEVGYEICPDITCHKSLEVFVKNVKKEKVRLMTDSFRNLLTKEVEKPLFKELFSEYMELYDKIEHTEGNKRQKAMLAFMKCDNKIVDFLEKEIIRNFSIRKKRSPLKPKEEKHESKIKDNER